MTALVSFAQDFQDFHLVRGDRFAPLTRNPAIARGMAVGRVFTRPVCTGVSLAIHGLVQLWLIKMPIVKLVTL